MYQEELRTLTAKQFAYLGFFDHAYIRAVSVDGAVAYAVYTADGRLLGRTADLHSAAMALLEQNLTAATIH